MAKKLDTAYKKTLADIQKLIKEGHHPKDITKDDPELLENIFELVKTFLEVTCAEGL